MESYKTKIDFSINLSSYSETKIFLKSLYNALEPDIKTLTSLNSYIVNRGDCTPSLIIEIATSDIAELRSFINSYLRLIQTIYLCIINLLLV